MINTNLALGGLGENKLLHKLPAKFYISHYNEKSFHRNFITDV